MVHRKETCSYCMMQETAGQAVFKENNPNYICLFNPINPRAKSLQKIQLQHPFPLKAGTQKSRSEKLVVLLQRLLLKIKLTKQPVSRLYPKKVDLIGELEMSSCVSRGHNLLTM